MNMPSPNENHARLDRLVGTWTGDEKMNQTPFSAAATAVGRYVHRRDLDGFFLLQDYQQERNGKISYRGHGVFGYDNEKKQYTWYWVDSFGMPPATPSRGQWDGDTLLFENQWGELQRGRYTYQFSGDDAFMFRLENTQDGGKTWLILMEGNYRKVS